MSLKRYKYTGMERDEETGLQRHGVRYYATWLGRWTSADPIALGDGVNRYGYCHGGPAHRHDTTGLEDLEYPSTLDILLNRDTRDFYWVGEVLVQRKPPPDRWVVGGETIYRSDFVGPLPPGARRGVSGGVLGSLPGGGSFQGEEGEYLWRKESSAALEVYARNAIPVPATLPVVGLMEATGAEMETIAEVLPATEFLDAALGGAALLADVSPKGLLRGRSTQISSQKQARHVVGTPEWSKSEGGYFLSEAAAQDVLDATHAGAVEYLGNTGTGNVVVRVRGVTGFNNNPGAGYLDQPTNVFMIKGEEAVSVVPIRPDWKPE